MFGYYILVVLFLNPHIQACNVETFHNTSVTVSGVRGLKTISGCFESSNNNSIDKVSFIQIINETVPTLYEDAFNNLENVVDIILEHDGIQDIYPKAFRSLPKLYLIRLKYNKFRVIREGVFNNLPLTELSLIDNGIEIVHERAFDDMPNLTIVLLNNNKIQIWENSWFHNTPKICELHFDNNAIRKLPTRAFQNIHGVHLINNVNVSTTIMLNNNQINEIEPNALDGHETFGWLFLQKNQIENFNSGILGSLKRIDWLRLEDNRLECIPEKLIEIAPNIVYYLNGNPLSDECVDKFNITSKNKLYNKKIDN